MGRLDGGRVRWVRAGRLVLRGEPGYEQARVGRIFNARRPDRYPAAVLREGYGHVAFDVADLGAAYDRAVARGARPVMPPCPSPEPGVRMAFVADPEGNLIELLDRTSA